MIDNIWGKDVRGVWHIAKLAIPPKHGVMICNTMCDVRVEIRGSTFKRAPRGKTVGRTWCPKCVDVSNNQLETTG